MYEYITASWYEYTYLQNNKTRVGFSYVCAYSNFK